MLVGYMRVLTAEQNLNLQRDALVAAGCEKIFEDVGSGAVDSRKGLVECLDYVRSGDTLVAWKLDRLGRSLKHLLQMVSDLEKRKVGLKVLSENIDTTTDTGRLVLSLGINSRLFPLFPALATGLPKRVFSAFGPNR